MLTSFNYQVFLNKKIKINVVFAIRVVDTAWSHDLTERHVHRGMRFWLRRHVSASGWTKPQTQHAAGALLGWLLLPSAERVPTLPAFPSKTSCLHKTSAPESGMSVVSADVYIPTRLLLVTSRLAPLKIYLEICWENRFSACDWKHSKR